MTDIIGKLITTKPELSFLESAEIELLQSVIAPLAKNVHGHCGVALQEGHLDSGDPSIVVDEETTNVTVGVTVPIEKKVDDLFNCNSPYLNTSSEDLGQGPSTSNGVVADKDLIQEVDLGGNISELYNNISDKQLWSLIEEEQGDGPERLEGDYCKTPLQCFAQNPESQSSACPIQSIRSNVTLRKGKKKHWARLKGGSSSLEPNSPVLSSLDLSVAVTSLRDLRAMSLGKGSK